MQHTSLEATTHSAGGTVVIELRGDIDGSARDALHGAYDEAGAGAMMLDFGQVEYINSTGIALIVGLLARARAECPPGDRARPLGAHYREIFEITRLSDFMTILADEQSPHNDEHGAAT